MLFKSVIGLMALVGIATAQTPPQKLIDSLGLVAKSATEAKDIVASLNFQNTQIKGLDVPPALNHVNSDLADTSQLFPMASPVPKDKQGQVCAKFKTAGDDVQALLKTLIDKHTLLSSFGFSSSIHTALVSMEHTFDTASLQIADVVSDCAATVKSVADSVGTTFATAVSTY